MNFLLNKYTELRKMIVGEIDDEQDRDEEEIIKDLDSGVLVDLSENEDDPPVCN